MNWRVVKWCEDNVRDPRASLRPVSRFKNWQVVSYAVDIAHEEQPDDHLVLSFHDTYKGPRSKATQTTVSYRKTKKGRLREKGKA